jgi:hypothetical protein
MLEKSPVFRQLDGGGRFGKFEPTDAIPVFLTYSLTYLLSFAVGFSALYAFVALASAAVATYLLRTKFEFGLMGLLRFLLHPKHFAALAADRRPVAYPGRTERAGEGAR